ncbi:MAG: glycoside hydrolase family 5 protein [Actinomycetota bacterium]|nr:glycoside hydrolase family 5 protein [Actinomycetota bacterium]
MSSRRLAPFVAVMLAGVLLVSCTGGSETGTAETGTDDIDGTTTSTAPAVEPIELRPLHVEEQRIVDDEGREVLLRGANVNALGEYARADPQVAPTAPVTDDDWEAMAANGFSVVRLLMSWSRLEPVPDRIDQGYLDEIEAAVTAANEHGIYVVLDMHQDAWGMSSATLEGTTCPPGTEPAIGWDGAPAWATITDGATTCRAPGSGRESAPAVQRAFANFYADTDGISGHLTAVWAAVAERFTGDAGVAGYDLLNEPNGVEPGAANQVAYSRWLQSTIRAIRDVESAAGAPPVPMFVEPLQLYPLPFNALLPEHLDDDQLVFAAHNYAESIQSILTLEQTFDIYEAGADELDAALWIGEYGFWDLDPDTLEVAARYAAEEDRRLLGGAWWQWRQTCGDPHSVAGPGAPATEDQIHLITRACPGHDDEANDRDAHVTGEFLSILGRAYPRAAPGHLTELESDPASGHLRVRGTDAAVGPELVVWLPDRGDATPLAPTTTEGLDEVELLDVPGGRRLTATATQSDWHLVVDG